MTDLLSVARNYESPNSVQGGDYIDRNVVPFNGQIFHILLGDTGLQSILFPEWASLTGYSKTLHSLLLKICLCAFYTGLF